MRILIEARDAEEANELIALINGSAAATGKKKPSMVIIEDSSLNGQKKWDGESIGYAFETLLVPLAKIESLHLGPDDQRLHLRATPSEYAILNTLLQKNLNQRPKAPF